MNTRAKGQLGESIASSFLEKHGFDILARNYLKKWGEIDIIAEKDTAIHFFEVKSVTVDLEKSTGSKRAHSTDVHRPEDNVHDAKLRHMRAMIQTYFMEKRLPPDQEFHFHVLCVYMDMSARKSRVQWVKDIIL